jgi:hypothetical protein
MSQLPAIFLQHSISPDVMDGLGKQANRGEAIPRRATKSAIVRRQITSEYYRDVRTLNRANVMGEPTVLNTAG